MNTPETMTKHDFSDLTPPDDLITQWCRKHAALSEVTALAARWGAEQAAERLKGQWPTPITDRPPTEADGDKEAYVQACIHGRWVVAHWRCCEHPWLHTPRWQPPAPPTLTPQQQHAMDALDHILKHSTTNLGEATIRRAILGGEA